jgi:L-ascorbate metabolism protein UlaG (beta-lactamase superfamily)
MAELAPVDVALLPVAGWGPSLGPGHMDAEQAARATALLRPGIAVPIHWGTYAPIGLKRGRDRLLRDPPLAFAEQVARLAPGTRVEILQPGGSLTLA